MKFLANIKYPFLCLAFVAATSSYGKTYLCYVPGAGGGSDYALHKLPGELTARGVDAISFDNGKTGSVQEKAARLKTQVQERLFKDYEFRCHFFAYSQGGIVVRYALNHLFLEDPTEGTVSFQKIAASFTTASTPHLGTPLARLGTSFFGPDFEEGLKQMSEEEMVRFNDPSYPDTYSPIVAKIATYSYRTFINSRSEARGNGERWGYEAIKSDLKKRGKNERNDGVVPTDHMIFGKLLNTFNNPHSFFSSGTDYPTTMADVIFAHAKFVRGELQGLNPDYPELLKAF